VGKTGQRIGSIIFVLIALLIFAYVDPDMSAETILVFIGSIAIIVSLGILLQRRSIKSKGEHANATVIRTRRKRVGGGTGGGVTYVPVVKFDVNGRTHETESNVGHMRPRYEDGATVRIIYSRKDAKQIIILNDGPTAAIITGIFLFLGVIMLGIALYRHLS